MTSTASTGGALNPISASANKAFLTHPEKLMAPSYQLHFGRVHAAASVRSSVKRTFREAGGLCNIGPDARPESLPF
jgi:hypothetical protein